MYIQIHMLLTITACCTKIGLCSHMLFSILLAALRRAELADLLATVSGYTSACGWCLPMSINRWWIKRLTKCRGVSIRAINCGITYTYMTKLRLWDLQKQTWLPAMHMFYNDSSSRQSTSMTTDIYHVIHSFCEFIQCL